MATLNIKNVPDQLYRRIQTRAKKERRSVAQEVIQILSQATARPASLSILALQGLGKEIWQGIKAGRYVDKERREWE